MSEDETFGGGDSIVGKTLGGGGRGEVWCRGQLNCGPSMTGVSISSLFIPQQLLKFLNTFRQKSLNIFRQRWIENVQMLPSKDFEEGANFHKKISLESRGLVIGRWQLIAMFIWHVPLCTCKHLNCFGTCIYDEVHKGSSWLEVGASWEKLIGSERGGVHLAAPG